MKKLIYLLIPIFFISCFDTEVSGVMNEGGFIIAKSYRDEINDTAPGMGISMNGDVSFTATSVHVPESYTIVFRCEHNKIFKIDDARIYEKVQEGDSVVITYREMYRIYDDNPKERVLVDYKFIDANKK